MTAPAPTGVDAFQFLREMEELACLADEAESGEPAEEIVTSMNRTGDDDLPRDAAARVGHVEQLPRAEGDQELLPHAADLSGSPASTARSSTAETASIGSPEFLRIAGIFAGRHQQPGRGGRVDAGGDDLLNERIFDRSQAVELDERFVRARRLSEAIAVNRFKQFEKLAVVFSRLAEPLVENFAPLGRPPRPR